MEKKHVKISPNGLKYWGSLYEILAVAVTDLRANYEAEKEKVDAYAQPICAKYHLMNYITGERVTKWNLAYNDFPDNAHFEFCDELRKAHAEHGWTGNIYGGPHEAILAEQLDVEGRLLNAYEEHLGLEKGYFSSFRLEDRSAALEQLLRICLDV